MEGQVLCKQASGFLHSNLQDKDKNLGVKYRFFFLWKSILDAKICVEHALT